MAQEMMQTFQEDLKEVTLTLGTGGVFDIYLDNELLISRKALGRFPNIKELKKALRDSIDPQRSLGHTDR